MWTPGALASEARRYAGAVWRVVETQYKSATMRITDSLEEQAILEEILEESKPIVPEDCRRLDYLLATPFRYAPYPFGSRFRRARQREGAFYAAEVVETAIAEAAFYQLLFFIESPEAKLPSGPGEYTAFSAACATSLHVDLTAAPFNKQRETWTHPTKYEPCQDFADAAREAGVQVVRYESARDPAHRANIAVLSCGAFTDPAPRARQTWHIFTRARVVQARCESPVAAIEFKREDFASDPRIG
jgi:RES domain